MVSVVYVVYDQRTELVLYTMKEKRTRQIVIGLNVPSPGQINIDSWFLTPSQPRRLYQGELVNRRPTQ